MCRVRGRVLRVRFLFSLSNDVTATRTSLKKWICVLSVFITIIPEVEFQGTISKSRNVKKKNFVVACWHSHKTRKRQRNAQKCVMHCNVVVCSFNLLLFWFCVFFFYALVAVVALNLKIPIDVVDVKCQNWPIIGFSRSWYNGMMYWNAMPGTGWVVNRT